MAAPESGVFFAPPEGGVVYEYTNDTGNSVQPEAACVSAPQMATVDVSINDNLVDRVFVQSSHTWWTAAGNRLFRYPLKPGQTLKVVSSRECAFRIDWYGDT